ncbi:ComEC/Rec2 family competence protein [Terrisporobacter glycolicus]|uniref:Metallo-beta-lactamase domain-containing protein n=1 Tax=Terrisporobacter glycolicus ATCC 14880 = DSM 1288 TaxID=1121315 RepID=A0ABZ2EVJ3_9FIRM|nr:ComEC/Rec2 family competence protein [Terrisporobacter glycolicus]
MKKYIAGFRSNNSKKKKKASIYYFLTTLLFLLGTSKDISDISLYLLLLMTPSLVCNFKAFIKKIKNKKKKEIFLHTLICYLITLCVFITSTPNINEAIADSQLLSETINKISLTTNKKEKKLSKEKDGDVISNVYEGQLHFINTGNSDAILIRQGGEAALIDGGDNDDEGTVVNYLKDIGVKELKYVIATHPDADHIGGLDAVINSIPVETVYVSNGDANTKTYSDFINAMSSKNLYPSVPLLGAEFYLGTSKFKVLSAANLNNPNDNSIVLEYLNGNDKMLLMGDAGTDIERIIDVKEVDLIKIGHHGSNTSSDIDFIKKINPQYAVITVGKNNRYGHPNKETMQTLKKENIEVHRSDECGNILFKSTGNGLIVNCVKGSYNYGR